MADNDDTLLLLGKIDGKLDLVIDKVNGQEQRISSLEKWRAYVVGAGAVLGVGASELWKWITK